MTSQVERTLLIIEDEKYLGEVLQDLLDPYFTAIDYAPTPEDAIALLKQKSYTVIMSDVRMPGLQGPELMRWIRSQGILTPLIFLTGHADRELLFSALRLGVMDVIEKPFDPVVLTASIDRVIEMEALNQRARDEKGPGLKKLIGLLRIVNEQKKTGT